VRFGIPLSCPRCGNPITVEAVGAQQFPDAKCTACGAILYSADSSTVGVRVLHRARLEIENGDFTLSIILSAMAVECEVASLFFKWKRVDFHMADTSRDVQVTEEQEQEWENEFRRWYTVTQKLDNFSKLMTGIDFDSFVSGDATLTKRFAGVQTGSNSASPKRVFAEQLFGRRNRILHSGKVDFGKLDAAECFEQAHNLLTIIAAMDRARYERVFPPQQSTSSI
jgi:hypothetical protein